MKPRAFTLVEMLVVLAIAAILLSLWAHTKEDGVTSSKNNQPKVVREA